MYKTLIAGRASCGKDLIAKYLEDNYGWKFVQSYTTRPKRRPDEHGHTFITKEDVKNIPKSEIATDAILNNNYYFSTKTQIEECDGYIVNPNAIPDLLKNCPDTYFQIIYIHPKDDETRYEMAVKRANESEDPDRTLQTYIDRDKDEDQEFTEFEEKIAANKIHSDLYECVSVTNTYTQDAIVQIADLAESLRRFHKNMLAVLKNITDSADILHTDILEYNKDKDFDKTDILFSKDDPVYKLSRLSTNPDDDHIMLELLDKTPDNIGRLHIQTFIRAIYHTMKLPESPLSLLIKIWLETCDAYGLYGPIKTITVDNVTYAVIKTLYRIEEDPGTTDHTLIPVRYHIIQERQETYVCVKEGENTSIILLKDSFYNSKTACETIITEKLQTKD